MLRKLPFFICSLLLIVACEPPQPEVTKEKNPAADGFNLEASDTEAIAVADKVMEAMGGRENWDNTKIISWTFFGRRTHTWDKSTGRNRIDIPNGNLVIDMNIHTKEGSVTRNGTAITEPDSIDIFMQRGYEMWVNDSYWLVMPYKLKDSGVTLTYMGIDNDQDGNGAHKLQLAFNDVGVTPQNRYHIFVDTTQNLITQWEYFRDSTATEPNISTPWAEYAQYGDILLSSSRGRGSMDNIKVMDTWPDFE